jgi:hypothetical protein
VGVCAGIKRNGGRCTVSVEPGQQYCHHHDPERSEQRSRAASKAGRAKPSREIVNIRGRLSDLADDVLSGRVDRADAAVAGQLLGTVVRAITAELKVKEVMELEERLAALEQALQRGGQNWRGA